MNDGIDVKILGDFGPFSRMGKSIGYQVTVGSSSYLLDCGSPLFQQIGGHGLKEIRGLIITHCHDDHKRWFSDLSLFNMYAADVRHKLFLIASEDVYDDLIRSSGPALERSLSNDSKLVIDIPHEEYINHQVIGPRAKFKIATIDDGEGKTRLQVIDGKGAPVSPDRAKIVVSDKTKQPRMLFKDPEYGEWIEPESFYPFSSTVFYEEDQNPYVDSEGFVIEAVKSPVWHGLPAIGIKVRTKEDILVFSSDTVHDSGLWKQLAEEKRPQRLNMKEHEFESAEVIYGDINDYIERIWSRARYEEAVSSFDEGIVIHDVSALNSVVHTDYEKLDRTVLKKERVILTHGPDRMTSEWVLGNSEKTFRIRGGDFHEVVGEQLHRMDADVYHKEEGRYYAGYRNEEGKYAVYEKNGLLGITANAIPDGGRFFYRVDFYEDISGQYFPKLDSDDAVYFMRRDGRVELIEFSAEGSSGKVVENQRKTPRKK
jgi:ribonuclease BN (tRNA processing enzyme)